MKQLAVAFLLAPASVLAQVVDFEGADVGAVPDGWSISRLVKKTQFRSSVG